VHFLNAAQARLRGQRYFDEQNDGGDYGLNEWMAELHMLAIAM
jgi:hypothetical protein